MFANLNLHHVLKIEARAREQVTDEWGTHLWREILITVDGGEQFRIDLFPDDPTDPSQLTIIDHERPERVTVDPTPVTVDPEDPILG